MLAISKSILKWWENGQYSNKRTCSCQKPGFSLIPNTRNTRWFGRVIGYGSGIEKYFGFGSGIGYPLPLVPASSTHIFLNERYTYNPVDLPQPPGFPNIAWQPRSLWCFTLHDTNSKWTFDKKNKNNFFQKINTSLGLLLAWPWEGWVKIYNVKSPNFSLTGWTPCPNEKSFWICVIYAPEGHVRVCPILFFWKCFCETPYCI